MSGRSGLAGIGICGDWISSSVAAWMSWRSPALPWRKLKISHFAISLTDEFTAPAGPTRSMRRNGMRSSLRSSSRSR